MRWPNKNYFTEPYKLLDPNIFVLKHFISIIIYHTCREEGKIIFKLFNIPVGGDFGKVIYIYAGYFLLNLGKLSL